MSNPQENLKLEIVAPFADEALARTFAREIQQATAAAIATGQLTPRPFPTPDSFSPETLLGSLERLVTETTIPALELVPKGLQQGWLEKLLNRVRLPIHQAILFYVQKVVQRQQAINQQTVRTVRALQRQHQQQQQELAALRAMVLNQQDDGDDAP